MRLPLLNSEDPTSIDLEQTKKMVDFFIENDFTYFDVLPPHARDFSRELVGFLLEF